MFDFCIMYVVVAISIKYVSDSGSFLNEYIDGEVVL